MLIRDWLKRLKGWIGPGFNRSKVRANHPQAIHRARVTSVEVLEKRVLLTAWASAGPTSIINGQLEGIAGLPLIGALNTVAPDPSNAGVIYVGAVNGGIWKTTNATSANPIWTPETDFQQSLSISSIEFDPTDATHNTLIAGIGRFSSAALQGGPRTGLLRTTNGGATWTPIDGNGILDGKNTYGVAARGTTLMASVNDADSHQISDMGLFRSTNGGTSFTQLTVANSGLPQGIVFDLTSDPANAAVFYCGVIQAENGVNGIYKTSNTGASWTLVSGSSINSLLVNATTSTIEMSVGTSNNLYVAVVNSGQLSGLFRSGDGGGTFTQLDAPTTNENGHLFGLEPDDDEDPGSSGGMHFSIVADPSNANLVYVGGDRQPAPGPDGVEGTADDTFPNSIGATQYDGRLFRIDASKAAGSQAVTLTHSNTLSPGGGGTASNSAPHADSRDMAIDALGRILEVDDGGIYRRTSPQNNTGDWFGVMGNLAVTEMHTVAYDSLSNTIISGNQDAGTTYQIVGGGLAYNALSNADGGEVLVDNTTLAGSNQSIRYSSYQSLAGFRRTVWDATGALVSTTFPALTVTSGSPLVPDFRTPIALNVTNPQRMLFVGFNSVYESFDSGNTISEVNDGGIGFGDDPQGSALAYGHPNNPDAIWFGTFHQVLVRTTLGGVLTPTAAPFPGTNSDIRQLALDTTTATANSVFVIDNTHVYRTTDTGSSWTDITGNLASAGAVELRSVVFIPLSGLNALVVGTQTGVYYSIGPNYNSWKELGTGVPNTLSFDLEYNATDDVLVDATLGRGAWILPNASQSIYNIDYGDAPDTTSGTGRGNYQTLNANNGPRHDTFLTQTTLFMGARVDGESNATPNVKANGDDSATSPDDEDGLIEPEQDLELTVGTAPVVRVRATNLTGSAATLYGWIDYNQDGVFTNASERVSITVPAGTTNGTFILTFPVIPANTAAGSTYARFRLSSDAAAGNSTGSAIDGEVEDYPASIALQTSGSTNSLQNPKIANATNGGPTLTTDGLFGNAVASLGDLDGDGVPDLAVGQVGDNTAGTGRGAVQILFMNTNGTVKNSAKIGSGTGGGPTLANLDQFGSSVSSLGDLDGDGVTDLAVGAMGDDTGGTDRGAVYVLFLNPNGTVKSSVKLASGLNGGPSLLDSGLFGSSVVSIGDLDGDGVTDLAVGATSDSTGGTNRGAVQVLFMNANGTVKSNVKLSSGSNGVPVLANLSQFGSSVTSLGDQNGDGITDVAVGAVGAGTGGSVYVLQLNANGTVKASTILSSGTNGVPTLGSGDKFGTSVTSLGDFDGDGVTDLAVGASGDDFNGTDRGAVYVLLLNATGTAKKSQRMASATNGAATLTDSDQFGSSVTLVGDLNRDGYPDLAVGTPGDDTGGNARGAAYILFLKQQDTTPPVLNSFTRQTPSSSVTNADTLVFRATFNEAVQNVDVADFAVTGTTATVTNVAAVSASNGLQYDITISGGNLAILNGTVGLNIAAVPTILDLADNPLPAAEPTTDDTFTVDNTAPTLSISPNGIVSNLNSFLFVFQFSETVTGFTTSDITVSNGTKGTFTAVDSDTYTLAVSSVADGVMSIVVGANAAMDLATNNSTASSAAITIDQTLPTLSITPNSGSTNANPILFTFQFSEVVSGFTPSDISITNGNAGTFTNVNGQTYTMQVTPLVDGAVTVNVGGDVAQDVATNGNVAASATVTSDQSLINLAITPSGISTNVVPVLFTFQFSKSVTGFTSSDISITNGNAGTFTAVDGDTYTLLVSAIADGPVTVNVNANAAQDVASNGNVAASSTVNVDRSNPGLSITPSGTATNTASVLFTFQFTEPVTGFTAGDVSLTNATAGTFTVVDSDTYTLLVTSNSEGMITATVGANVAQDAATNGNTAASATVNFDLTAPGLTITPNNTSTNANPILFTFQFTETVTGFTVNDISLTNGTAGTFSAVDGDTYTLLVTPTVNGTVLVNVGANAAQDLATNGSTVASASVISDQAPPGLVITPNGILTTANTITFTFQFTKPVTGFTSDDIAVTNGTTGTFTAVDGDTYTLLVTPNLEGAMTIHVNADVAQDLASNGNTEASASVTVDRTAPSLTINPNGTVTNASSILFTFQFSETVTGFTASDISVTNGTAGTFTAVDGDTYTLLVSPATDGAVSVTVNSNVAQDLATNGNTSATATVISDRTVPTLSISPNGTLTGANSLLFTFQFSKTVTGFTAGDISITNGTAGAFTAVDGDTYTLVVSPVVDGAVSVQVNANAAQDSATNGNLAASATVTSDRTVPSLTITPNGTLINATSITFTFQFTETVTGFTAGDISVTNGTAGTFTAVDGDTYTLVVAPIANGTVAVNVGANAAQDLAANGNAAAGATVTSDRVNPSLTITPNGTSTNANSILFTFQFSEAVTGFTAGDISVVNGTAGTFTAVDSDTYTLLVSPTGDVAVSVNVAANAAQDLATNGSTAASAVVTVDRTGPDLAITPNGTLTNSSSVLFTFQFTEAVTGFAAGDISVTNGTAGAFSVVDSDTYTLAVTPTVDGTVRVNVGANSAQDAATNGNTAATASVSSDRTNPGLSITPNSGVTNANSILFTFQFTETVTGFTAGDISVSNGTAGTFTVVDGDTYTLAVTPNLDGAVGVILSANSVQDAAANGNSGANASVMVDRTAPSLSIKPNGAATNANLIVFTFQFTEPVAGFTASDVVLTNGSPGTFTTVDASTYTLQVTPTANGPVQVNVAAGVAQDAAANGNTAASASETSDRTNPGLSITPDGATSNAGSILFTFQFTEPVTGFFVGDIALTNGRAGTFTAIDGDTYTLAVTPIQEGTVAVNVAANAAQDPATNGSTAASASVTSDRTNPGLSITPNGSLTNTSSVLMTFEFTEPVTGFTVNDISITNGTAGSFTAVDGDTYTLLVSPTLDGLVSVNVSTNAAQDSATNGNLAASATFNSDQTAPGLTITPNGSLTNSSSILFRFQFTEPVSEFAANDIVLTNGSAGVFTTVDDETYTLLVTPLSNGVVSVSVGADLAADVAINGNTAASASITSDRTAPNATVETVSPNSRTTRVDNLTIVFSEPITGFGINDLALTRGGGANLLTGGQTLTSTDNMTFNLGNLGGLTTAVGNYLLRLNATGSGIQDAAGNALLTAVTTTWTRVNPVVTLSVDNASISETAGAAVITATLSSITDVDVTVGLTFDGTASFPQDYSSSASQIVIPAGSTSATITVTAVSDSELEGTESIIVSSSSVTNGTISGSLQTSTQILDDDHAPVFTGLAAVSVLENSVTSFNITATDADLPVQTISYTLSGGADRTRFTLSSDGKLAFVAVPDFENPTDAGRNNVYNVQIRADDGQAGVTFQNLTITVTDIDEIPPTISIVPVSITPRSAPVDAVTIVLSEAVNGFDLSDLSLTRNGGANLLTGAQSLSTNDNVKFTLSGLSGLTNADGVYFLTVSPAATGIVDLAGNALAGGASTNWTTDITPPSVVITPVSPDPRYTPVSSVNIVFQERVNGFQLGDLSLTRDGGQNLLSGLQTLTTVDNINYTLGNLTGITGPIGDYVLSLLPANSTIQDQAGNLLVTGATDEWVRATPEVALSVNKASIAEAAGTATVTASLSAATDVDVTVVLGFSGTASFPTDYARGATQIVIPAGSTSNSVVLTAVQDGDIEPAESIIVDITSVTNGVESGAQQVQTEIVDDDHAPVFTSAATASIPENTTSIMTVIATDADLPAQTIGYTITGGLDQGLFAISGSGVLSFLTAPNFELPSDSDLNNIYNIQVTANDSHGGVTSQNISVTVTNVNEPPTLSLGGPAVTWIYKKPAVVVLPQITATAEGSLAGGTLTISVNAVGTKKKLLDIFGIPNSTALGSGSGPHVVSGQLTLQISLQESATTSGIEAFLHGITFATKGTGLKLLTRSMVVTLTDAHGLSSTVRQTINVRKKA